MVWLEWTTLDMVAIDAKHSQIHLFPHGVLENFESNLSYASTLQGGCCAECLLGRGLGGLTRRVTIGHC